MYFYASKVLWSLLSPLNALVLLAFAGVLLGLTRWRRAGWWLSATSLAAILAIGTLPIGKIVLRPLEERFAPWRDDGGPVAGIIVLGGAFDTTVAAHRHQFSVNEAGERLVAMAVLARRWPDVPVVFTGGSGRLVVEEIGEGDALRPYLGDLGLAEGRVVIESRSRNTVENAAAARAILTPRPDDRFILVTSAFHMPRSVGLFRAAGFTVLPWPVDYRTGATQDDIVSFGIGNGFAELETGLREWVGLAAARVLGHSRELLPREPRPEP